MGAFIPPDQEKGAQLALTDREDRLMGDLYVREEGLREGWLRFVHGG